LDMDVLKNVHHYFQSSFSIPIWKLVQTVLKVVHFVFNFHFWIKLFFFYFFFISFNNSWKHWESKIHILFEKWRRKERLEYLQVSIMSYFNELFVIFSEINGIFPVSKEKNWSFWKIEFKIIWTIGVCQRYLMK
jgi:hypothetical protein